MDQYPAFMCKYHCMTRLIPVSVNSNSLINWGIIHPGQTCFNKHIKHVRYDSWHWVLSKKQGAGATTTKQVRWPCNRNRFIGGTTTINKAYLYTYIYIRPKFQGISQQPKQGTNEFCSSKVTEFWFPKSPLPWWCFTSSSLRLVFQHLRFSYRVYDEYI